MSDESRATPSSSPAPGAPTRKHDVSYFVQALADAAEVVGTKNGLDTKLLATAHLLNHFAERLREIDGAASPPVGDATGEPTRERVKFGAVTVKKGRYTDPVKGTKREVYDVIIMCGKGRKNADAVMRLVSVFLHRAKMLTEEASEAQEEGCGCGSESVCAYHVMVAEADVLRARVSQLEATVAETERDGKATSRMLAAAEWDLAALNRDYATLLDESNTFERERDALRRMLETSTVRLGILRDRMEGCDDGKPDEDKRHGLSMAEVPHWIAEQEAACRLDECSEDCEVDETTGECKHAGPAVATPERPEAAAVDKGAQRLPSRSIPQAVDVEALTAARLSAEQETERLRADAERYRFLRDNGLGKALRARYGFMELHFGYDSDGVTMKTGMVGGSPDMLIDTAIDAARRTTPETPDA